MEFNDRILVTGAAGMGGSAVVRQLKKQGYRNVIPVDKKECNLLVLKEVEDLLFDIAPTYVFHIAAKVGGINANNTQSADFIYENLMIQCHVMDIARRAMVKKLLFCGSACIYPKNTIMPIREEYLLSGYLEETNKAYSVAKIAGVTMCEMYRKQYGCDFISAMPTNLYGIGDNFHLTDSHVMPALIRKLHEAKINGTEKIKVWGTGNPRREFLYVDDLAEALVFLMNNYSDKYPINVGTGVDIPISELLNILIEIIGYRGVVDYDTIYPDGVYERRLDVTKINQLGWKAQTSLRKGIQQTYNWFVQKYDTIRT